MIQLNYRDARPIKEQVKNGIKRLIEGRGFLTNERLPSVRELSSKLAINPKVISRAYEELMMEGYLLSFDGMNAVVSDEWETEKNIDPKLWEQYESLVKELAGQKATREELLWHIEEVLK